MSRKTKQNLKLTILPRLRKIIEWLRDKLLLLLLLPFVIVVRIAKLIFRVILGVYNWIVISVNKYYHPILTFLSPLNSFVGTNYERAVETLVQIEKLIGHEFNEKHSRSIIDYLTVSSASSILFIIQSYTPFQIDETTKQKLVALLKEWEEEQSNFLKKEFYDPMGKFMNGYTRREDTLIQIEKMIGYDFNKKHYKNIMDYLMTESAPTILSIIESYTPFPIDEITKQNLVGLLKQWEEEKSRLLEDE